MKRLVSYISFPVLLIAGVAFVAFSAFYVYFDEPKGLDWIGNILLIIVLLIALKLIVEWAWSYIVRFFKWIVGFFKRKDK